FGSSPSFMAMNDARTRLYAVDESMGKVGAYAIDGSALRFLGAVSSHGDGPAHVAVDRTGRFVLVANYDAGSIAVLATKPDGSLGALVDSKTVGAAAHEVALDSTNEHLWVPCKSGNEIYRFDFADGHLSGERVTKSVSPRHIAFRPPYAYVVS